LQFAGHERARQGHPLLEVGLRANLQPVDDDGDGQADEVQVGRAVDYEHRSRMRATARLAGLLTIDGAPPGAGCVVVRTFTPHASITSYETTLDPDGRFELVLEPDLATSILVHLARDGVELQAWAKPVIVPGPNEWSANVTTARLEGTLPPRAEADGPLARRVTYTVEHHDLKVQASWTPGQDGRFGPISVPTGHGMLRGPSQGITTAGEVLAQLDLEVGEARRVTLP